MSGERILVVDDNRDIRTGLAQYLEAEGYDVQAANSGELAVEMIKNRIYDLVVTDLKMADTDGIAVLEEAKKKDPKVEVILMTSYGTIGDNIKAKKLGVSGFLTKPIDMAILLTAIKENMARRKGTANLFVPPEKASISAIGKEISTRLTLGSSLRFILKSACEAFDADGGTLLLRDCERLVIKIKTDNFKDSVLGTELPLEEPEAGPAGAREQVRPQIRTKGLSENPCFNGFIRPMMVKCGLSIPVMEGDMLLGVLNLSRVGGKPNFTEEDAALASDFAFHIKFSLENAIAYEEVIHAKAYAEKIIESMMDGLIVLETDGTIRTVNSAVLKLAGYNREEIIGRPAADYFVPTGKEHLFTGSNLKQFFKKDIVGYYELHNLIAKNGTDIPVGTSSSAMCGAKEELSGLVCVIRDMRETQRLDALVMASMEATRKKAVELQEAYDKLTAANRELAESHEKIVQSCKMAAVGQLAGGVVHELNNPLGIILGFAQSAANGIKETDPLHATLKIIEREATRCKVLVADLLKFSRTGKVHMELCSITRLVEETLSLVEAKAKTQNIEVIRECVANLPQITVKANQIQQLLVNLCNNAIDAMSKGGTLTVTTAISGSWPGHVELRVRDTGAGVPKDLQKKIFDPFFTTKEAGKGTGLGLSLVSDIVNRHGGVIELKSEEGKGAEFTVFLPIYAGPPSKAS